MLAANPADLRGRLGFVAVIDAENFTPEDHEIDLEPWSYLNTTDRQVPVLGGAIVSDIDILGTVFQIDEPSRAFFEVKIPA